MQCVLAKTAITKTRTYLGKINKNSTAKMPTGRSKSLVLSRKLALLKCIHGVLKTNRQAARQKDTETERRET